MTIDFTCQKCEASFELDFQDLIDGTEKLVCPHCEAKATANQVEDFVAALTEIRSQVAALSKKFAVSFAMETEDVADEAADEDVDEDEESDGDDDELDFDGDEDTDDEEDYDEADREES